MAIFHGYVSLPESNHVFFIFAEITQLLIILSENCRGQPQAPLFVLLGQLLAAEAVPSKRWFTGKSFRILPACKTEARTRDGVSSRMQMISKPAGHHRPQPSEG
jgi:hypothetical protein